MTIERRLRAFLILGAFQEICDNINAGNDMIRYAACIDYHSRAR